MSSMRKWSRSIENLLGETLNVVLFTSRNKDNRHVENFKERRESFVTTLSADSESLKDRFDRFVQSGVDGEMSRMYISINPRSNEKTKKDLMIKMLSDNVSLARVPEMTARLASKKRKYFRSSECEMDVRRRSARKLRFSVRRRDDHARYRFRILRSEKAKDQHRDSSNTKWLRDHRRSAF